MTENVDYHGKDPTEFYDNIIKLVSLKESCTSEGFPVESSEEGMKNYVEQKEKDATVIGVVGNAKKGKSYILGKISNNPLPTGHSVTTEGISVKYPTIHGVRVVVLDSAGSEAPLTETEEVKLDDINKSSENELIERIADIARDKQATENFLQSFILFSSNVLIIVVGQLTYSDQKMINRIKKEIWKQKYIFIIHNYMFLEKIEEVKEFIKDNVLTSITFGELIENHIIGEQDNKEVDDKTNDIYYTESYENNKRIIKIVHLFMAQEKSEAGNYYNNSTIEYLRKQLITCTKVRNYDVISKFKNYLALSSGRYMEDEIKEESIEYNENERKFRIKQDKPIKLKKCFIDEIGTPNFFGNVIEPNFDCQIKENKIIIRIEIPGEKQPSDFKPKIIPIRGFYNFNCKGKMIFPVIDNPKFKDGNMKDGEFRLDFKIPMNIGTIKNSPPEITFDETNGIVIVTYEISKFDEKEEDSDIDI
jgi:hypothetical protein